jgi:hypothetical protein
MTLKVVNLPEGTKSVEITAIANHSKQHWVDSMQDLPDFPTMPESSKQELAQYVRDVDVYLTPIDLSESRYIVVDPDEMDKPNLIEFKINDEEVAVVQVNMPSLPSAPVPENETGERFKSLTEQGIRELIEHNPVAYAQFQKTEKNVVTLPAELIKNLEVARAETNDVWSFLEGGINLNDYNAALEHFEDEATAINTLGNWYLGHVEFKAEEEPKFRVVVIFNDRSHYVSIHEVDEIYFTNDENASRSKFTEAAADELVAGLSKLFAKKVPVNES